MPRWTLAYLARGFGFVIAAGTLLLAQAGLADETEFPPSDNSATAAEAGPFRLAQQPADVPDVEEEPELPPEPPPDLAPLAELAALLEQPVLVPGESPATLTMIEEVQPAPVDGGIAAVPRITPAAVTRIDEDMIWLSGARSLNEAFDIFVPNLQTITMARQGEKLGIRGIISNNNDKILLKVNGKLMNDRTRAGAFSELDLAMLGDIHHVDVIRGPGSVIDGPGAIAGVINTQTHTGLTFQGLDATVRQGLIEYHTTAEVRYGRKFNDDTGVFVYYGMSDYAGADRNNAPFFYSSTFTARDGSLVIPGEPAPAGIPVPNAHEAYLNQVKHKFHAQFTHGNLDIWARLTNSGEQVGPQRQVVIDPPTPGFPGFAGRSDLSAGSEQFTLAGNYVWELSDTLEVEWRLSYDTLDYVLTAVAGDHSSHREDEVYARVLGRWTPHERHAIALGYAWSHEWFGLPTRGFPGLPPVIVGLTPDNTFPWEANTHSLMGEYQLQINDCWTGFAGIRTDKHSYTNWLVSPRAALVWTPNERDTLKGIWTMASRRAGDGVLRNVFLDNAMFAEVEEIKSAEMRYERRPCEHWLLAAGFFWQYLNQISYSPAAGREVLLGQFQSAGCELEATYRAEDTHFMFSHAYTQLLNGVLGDPTLIQGITAEPYGFGRDLAGWSPHITKLYLAHDLNDCWTASGSLRVYWGFPGDEDLANFNNTLTPPVNQLPVADPGFTKAFRGSYFLDFGLERRFACDRGVARLDLYNVLGWIDRDLNKRNMLRRASWRDEAAALGLSVRWEF